MDSTEDLRLLLHSEAGHIDLDDIPAPWSRIYTYENITARLDNKLLDYLDAKECIETYDDTIIEKVILSI